MIRNYNNGNKSLRSGIQFSSVLFSFRNSGIVKNCTKTGVYKAPKSWNTTIIETINTIEKIIEENKACVYEIKNRSISS